MVAILRMGVVMHPARAVIPQVRPNDSHYRERKQPILLFMPDLLRDKKGNADGENDQGNKAVMVPAVAMPQRVSAYDKCQCNHKIFEPNMIDDIHAQDG